MQNLLILAPAPIVALSASRGSGALNLLTDDPREVWADSAVGSAATIDIDLGIVRAVDTVFVGHLLSPLAAASWSITGGAAGYAETVLRSSSDLRVPDVGGTVNPPALSHALWHGAGAMVRYIRISLIQPGSGTALTAGALLVGRAFVPQFNREWGSGRRPIDTGSVTALPGGGFAIVPGVRKSAWSWSHGGG